MNYEERTVERYFNKRVKHLELFKRYVANLKDLEGYSRKTIV